MNEVTNKEAVLTLLGVIGVAALIALLLLSGTVITLSKEFFDRKEN